MSGALSYSAGLLLLLESPFICLHGSLIFNIFINCWTFTFVCCSLLAVQDPERQVRTFGLKLCGRTCPDVLSLLFFVVSFFNLILSGDVSHFSPSAMCAERAVTLSPAEIPMLF